MSIHVWAQKSPATLNGQLDYITLGANVMQKKSVIHQKSFFFTWKKASSETQNPVTLRIFVQNIKTVPIYAVFCQKKNGNTTTREKNMADVDDLRRRRWAVNHPL